MRIEDMLRRRIESDTKKLESMDAGTEEYKATVDAIARFSDKLIEIQKFDNKLEQEVDKQEKDAEFKERELKLKEQEIKEQKKDRLVKIGIGLLGTVITVAGSIFMKKRELASNESIKKAERELAKDSFKAAMEFEEKGTIATFLGKHYEKKVSL